MTPYAFTWLTVSLICSGLLSGCAQHAVVDPHSIMRGDGSPADAALTTANPPVCPATDSPPLAPEPAIAIPPNCHLVDATRAVIRRREDLAAIQCSRAGASPDAPWSEQPFAPDQQIDFGAHDVVVIRNSRKDSLVALVEDGPVLTSVYRRTEGGCYGTEEPEFPYLVGLIVPKRDTRVLRTATCVIRLPGCPPGQLAP
jgi:hypothetical protein